MNREPPALGQRGHLDATYGGISAVNCTRHAAMLGQFEGR